MAQKAGEAISNVMESNKKVAQLKHEFRIPDRTANLTSDFGVKEPTHDLWLSASTEERKGPLLLEDNLAREKASLVTMELCSR
jgi:catalase